MGGNVVVRRPDCSDLIAIRDGGSSFDALVQQLHSVRQATAHALATGNLRSEPDVSLASELLSRLLTAHLVTQSEDDEYPLN